MAIKAIAGGAAFAAFMLLLGPRLLAPLGRLAERNGGVSQGLIGVVLVAAGILLTSSFFIVDQTEQALVLQLGEVRRVIREPGLQMKRPFIENVISYDKRVLDFEPPHEEIIVSDQKRLVEEALSELDFAALSGQPREGR